MPYGVRPTSPTLGWRTKLWWAEDPGRANAAAEEGHITHSSRPKPEVTLQRGAPPFAPSPNPPCPKFFSQPSPTRETTPKGERKPIFTGRYLVTQRTPKPPTAPNPTHYYQGRVQDSITLIVGWPPPRQKGNEASVRLDHSIAPDLAVGSILSDPSVNSGGHNLALRSPISDGKSTVALPRHGIPTLGEQHGRGRIHIARDDERRPIRA